MKEGSIQVPNFYLGEKLKKTDDMGAFIKTDWK
jgi:hypothetical protein